ncbi:MAG: hypothetical protein ACI35W_02085 [Anaeroplasmataceae bacterium]
MRWEEFINRGVPDEESTYDGWYIWDEKGNTIPINFYVDYRHMIFGMQLGMNNTGNKFKDDEAFNIELKCMFPNIILIDNFERKDDKMKFFCEVCKHSFIKTGISVLDTGCPYCRESKYRGEDLLIRILDKRNIDYVRQMSYGCINPKTGHELYYDFIIDYNGDLIFVEVQGGQHYQPIDFFGGEDAYEYNVYKDNVKRKYAEENGVYVALDYREHNLKLLEKRIEEQLIPLIN